ncbi:hypothetical protein [Nocardioides sp. LML1-1-1.1]
MAPSPHVSRGPVKGGGGEFTEAPGKSFVARCRTGEHDFVEKV